MKKVGVIGLGLIGGSIALKLRSNSDYHVIGFDASERHAARALELRLVEDTVAYDQLLSTVDLIVLATPVDILESLSLKLLGDIREGQYVLDVGSTKLNICEAIKRHPKRANFIACHPLAGTEHSGPDAAIDDLFEGKKNIICDRNQSSEEAVQLAAQLFEDLGMANVFMDAGNHDIHLAYVSHLSHVSSFVLSETVLNIEEDEDQIFNLASTGFESTARLAKSNPKTWSAIFEKNKLPLVRALNQYILEMERFKSLIEQGDVEGMIKYMESANKIKRVLKGIQLNKIKVS